MASKSNQECGAFVILLIIMMLAGAASGSALAGMLSLPRSDGAGAVAFGLLGLSPCRVISNK